MLYQFDVAIVGAGAAGLAAARRLHELGLSAVVLEASDRVGGRAYTDRTTFGISIDLGCAWLHQADRNPLTPLGRRLGFDLIDHEAATVHYFDGGEPLDAQAGGTLASAFTDLSIELQNSSGSDRAMSDLLASSPGWAARVAISSAAELDTGGDASDSSVNGVVEQGSTAPNFLVRQGMGTLVDALSGGVSVSLGQKVSAIRQTSRGVEVTTTGGLVKARHCVVTVSTGVLRAESIRFEPALSNEALGALDSLPMGHFNKVILAFDRPLPDFQDGDWISEARTARADKPLIFLVNPFGASMVIAFAGGTYGRELSLGSSEQATDEVLSRLRDCLGGLRGCRLSKSLVTDWARNSLFNGSYAYLRTGGGMARKALSQAGSERIHFAGEATAIEFAQTCGGAYLTGQAVAERIAALNGAS